MQKRLIASGAGALVGASLTPLVGGFGLGPSLGIIACAFTGLSLGYVTSMLVDVFRA